MNPQNPQQPFDPNTQPPQPTQPAIPTQPQQPLPPAQAVPPQPQPQPNPGQLPQPQPVDTSALFAPDQPGEAPHGSSKKKRILISIVAIAFAIAVGVIGVWLTFGGGLNNSESLPDETEISTATDNLDAETFSEEETEGEDSSSDKTTKDKKSSSSANGSGQSSSGSSTSSSSSGTSSSGTGSTGSSSSSSSGFTKVSCSQDTSFGGKVSSAVLKQIENTVNAAQAGKSKSVVSWLSAKNLKDNNSQDPAKVDASFKKLKPRSCKALVLFERDKNDYSTKGITLYVTYSKNAYGKTYASSINVAYANGKWKTDRITTAFKAS